VPAFPTSAFAPFEGEELAVSLTVKDLDRSLAWYRDVLGFRITQRHEREGRAVAASLAAGGVKILLGQDDGAKGWHRVKGQRFSLQITTRQDIDGFLFTIASVRPNASSPAP
jgi:catechol 2,3-dioxygenase-like lactoylglutathione lyase family enzyme